MSKSYDLTKPDFPMIYDKNQRDFVPYYDGTDAQGDFKKAEHRQWTKDEIDGFNVLPEETTPVHSSGAKREKLGSPRYDLLPARIVNDYYGAIAEFGAKKYAPRNWEKGLPQSQIAASLQRHLWAYMEGEDLDTGEGGSNLPHVGHILWNAVALLYHYHHNKEDDRYPLNK